MGWNNLTDRQKSLYHAIEPHGVNLDNSYACRVMNAIETSASETSFVKQRIELCLHTAALLNKTDDFISNTEKMLYEKDDEEWRKKGYTLGFDF